MDFVKRNWFPILCGFIVMVSLYDTFLIVRYSEQIRNLEENPIGRWLIDVAGGGVGIFVRCKLAGTTLVVVILTCLHRMRSRTALPVTSSIAAYQTGLLTYLTLA